MIKNKNKNKNGFTIIEIIITVFVIAVLAAITVISYNKVQVDARDAERSSKTKIIATALEKYFDKNGEYPGCAAMTQSGALVSTNVLTGTDAGVFLSPKASAGSTNSIVCTALTAGSGPDAYAYVGDAGVACTTGAACLRFTLQYRQESTGNIVSIDGRRQITGTIPGAPTVTAQVISNTQVDASWTAVANASNYILQRATNSGFTTGLVQVDTTNLSVQATGLAPGTTYYFRLAAVGTGGQGAWSSTVSATTTISAPPSAPTVTLASSPAASGGKTTATSVTPTASVVTCASGTAEYQLRYRSMNAAEPSYPSWGGTWSTSRTIAAVSMSQGYRYDFQARARCTNSISSNPTVDSAAATIIREINTPPAPTYLSPPAFWSNVNAIVNYSYTCPSGTTLLNGHYDTRAWTGGTWYGMPFGFNDSWENYDGVDRNTEYWGYYQCRTPYDDSPSSPGSYNVIVVHP